METTAKYSRKQLAESRLFRENRDLLTAVLEEEKLYSKKEAEDAMEAYRKMKVKRRER